MREPQEMPYGKCRELLAAGVLGRVAVLLEDGPAIVPVNYAVVGESIVFRTLADGVIARHDWGTPVAFEVDHVVYADHRGWSVLARGPAEKVEDPEEVARINRVWEPRPWASGDRSLYVRIPWRELTGRRLGGGWTYADELPVRRQV